MGSSFGLLVVADIDTELVEASSGGEFCVKLGNLDERAVGLLVLLLASMEELVVSDDEELVFVVAGEIDRFEEQLVFAGFSLLLVLFVEEEVELELIW